MHAVTRAWLLILSINITWAILPKSHGLKGLASSYSADTHRNTHPHKKSREKSSDLTKQFEAQYTEPSSLGHSTSSTETKESSNGDQLSANVTVDDKVQTPIHEMALNSVALLGNRASGDWPKSPNQTHESKPVSKPIKAEASASAGVSETEHPQSKPSESETPTSPSVVEEIQDGSIKPKSKKTEKPSLQSEYKRYFEGIGFPASSVADAALAKSKGTDSTYGFITFEGLESMLKGIDARGKTFYDLGSGIGGATIGAAMLHPELEKAVGIELSIDRSKTATNATCAHEPCV
mmetsp:Transcript_10032/g.19248  ORF Transcript_10032/g.19248 Transcript_10032/m.19248 type:complete len:293 (-) Transcript_10032:567-1445(-)|eukprot:CAMPEP_0170176016 /NCGR_PEP_ID=MMETSP0040_2-20121228/8978_1 /TAXON_ID=641309 /ORGANISM="Lotharella oceanica, Strain CCMP622" /LENGTH=292 /DNA_ID=CAMNT_0010418203 /DNA_START=222 /DNA_END=1100 /DNA_ORIENTATION=+